METLLSVYLRAAPSFLYNGKLWWFGSLRIRQIIDRLSAVSMLLRVMARPVAHTYLYQEEKITVGRPLVAPGQG